MDVDSSSGSKSTAKSQNSESQKPARSSKDPASTKDASGRTKSATPASSASQGRKRAPPSEESDDELPTNPLKKVATSSKQDAPSSSASQSHKRASFPFPLGTLNERSKRAKTDGIRHEEFWFDDGNVVVRVQDHLFRVHSSILKRESSYFSELFSRDNGEDDEAKVDGCEVFDLGPHGKKKYFTALLDGLYGNLFRMTNRRPSFFTLACLLRAAHQWDVPSCKAWAISQFEKRWPATIESAIAESDIDEYVSKLIVLLRDCNLDITLLKLAFYCLARLPGLGIDAENECQPNPPASPVKDEDAGSDEEDDGEEDEELEDEEPEDYDHEMVEWGSIDGMISREDIALAFRTVVYRTNEWRNLSCTAPQFPFLSDGSKHKHSKNDCKYHFGKVWSRTIREAQFAELGWMDPLVFLDSISSIRWADHGICASCVTQCKASWKGEQVRIWEGLDEELGLQ
ncbi:hypothetical protein BOTBODRAFT_36433 [Botryobasidium botryosum FD-172 SS1]|uniref:BTB domain-containing protein n=1 Tax=Botryobasidium botryosum (strain FD-172 SS1) TaxID=930990 RepID=A0A067MEX4_BOTB1|nr:hypothetical protein BOTBODRAFT_36433 [Botryobasidium botryosum FD-172 SS1]